MNINSDLLYQGGGFNIIKVLDSIPFWQMVFVITSIILVITLGLIFVTHQVRRPVVEMPISEGAYMGNDVNAAIYGLILAFLVISMYDTNKKVEESTIQEAGALVTLLQTSQVLSNAAEIKMAVKEYTHELLEQQWPLILNGDTEGAWQMTPEMVQKLYTAVQASKPVGSMQENSCMSLLETLKDLTTAHRLRLTQAETHLPLQFWRAIACMTILTIWFLAYMNPWNGLSSLIPVIIPGMLISLSIALLISLHYPFIGPFAISNKVYSQGALDFSQDHLK